MKSSEQEELNRLCIAVIHEPDTHKLSELVAELNEFLERRERKKSSDFGQTIQGKGQKKEEDDNESVLKKSA